MNAIPKIQSTPTSDADLQPAFDVGHCSRGKREALYLTAEAVLNLQLIRLQNFNS